MNFVYLAHSGTRYLVLLSGLIAIVVLLRGMLAKGPYDRAARIAASSFAGLASLQGLLGIILVILRPFYPALMGHLVMMILAIAGVQTLTGWAKKAESDPARAYRLAVAGVVLALVLMIGGILAIGRGPLQSTVL
jgi:hypothetical protein